MTAELDHIGITVAGLGDVPSWDSVPARLADSIASLRGAIEHPDPEVISAFIGVPVDAVTRMSAATTSGVVLELLAFTTEERGEAAGLAVPGTIHLGVRVPDLRAAVDEVTRAGGRAAGASVKFGAMRHEFVRSHAGAFIEFIAPDDE